MARLEIKAYDLNSDTWEDFLNHSRVDSKRWKNEREIIEHFMGFPNIEWLLFRYPFGLFVDKKLYEMLN